MNVKLTCPQCGQHYSVEIDPSLIYEDMTCQNCGGKIPVSANPPAPPAAPDVLFKPGDPAATVLKCPSCQSTFTPPFDVKEHVGGMDCPICGKGIRAPLENYDVNRKPQQPAKPAPAKPTYNNAKASFFYGLFVFFFILGNIMALVDDGKYIGFAGYCGGATIIFLLNAIYFKISAK